MPIAPATTHTGLSQATIRFYEKSGMLPKIARNAQGWRDVHGDTLTWLVTLGHLRSTGMPLANVKRFAQSAHAPDCDSEPQARMRLAQRRADLAACETYLTHKIGIYTALLEETS